jgi:hypothetical protein
MVDAQTTCEHFSFPKHLYMLSIANNFMLFHLKVLCRKNIYKKCMREIFLNELLHEREIIFFKILLPHGKNIFVDSWNSYYHIKKIFLPCGEIFLWCGNDNSPHHLFDHLKVVMVMSWYRFILLYIMNMVTNLVWSIL